MPKHSEAGRDAKKVQKALGNIREVRCNYSLDSPMGRLLQVAWRHLQDAARLLNAVAWLEEEGDG